MCLGKGKDKIALLILIRARGLGLRSEEAALHLGGDALHAPVFGVVVGIVGAFEAHAEESSEALPERRAECA